MVATKRNANKGDDTQLLSFDQKKEASSSSNNSNNKRMGGSNKKKGLFSVFQKKTAATEYEPLLATAPSTPETPMNVTVVSNEYDPTCAYRLSSSDTMISGLTERDGGAISSTPRRVGFAAGSGTGTGTGTPSSHPNKNKESISLDGRETTLTPVEEEAKTTMTLASVGDKPALEGTKPSWANQTLGFFDEICNPPKIQTKEGDMPILLNAERPQWGTAPSEDDESTYASFQSTVDESKSTMDHTYSVQTGSNSTRGTATANNQSVEVPNRKPAVPQQQQQQQQLEKSPSHDHENFEVVLDTSVLGSNSPQRRGWFSKKDGDDGDEVDEPEEEMEQDDTHEAAALESMAAEAQARSPARKSLVKRLFSSRKVKKNDEAAAEKARELARQESLRGTVFLENLPTEPLVEEEPTQEPVEEEKPVRELSAIEEDNEDAQDASTWGSLMGTLDPVEDENEPGLIKLVERPIEYPEEKAEEPQEEINLNESIEVAKEEPQSTVKDKKEKKHKLGLSLGLLKIGKGVKGVVSKLKSISHDDSSHSKSSSVSKQPSAAAAPPVKQKKQKPTWKAVVDPNSGRTYYYHRKTRETTWQKPEELKKLEAELNSAASDYTPTHKNGDAGASTPSRDEPNASGGNLSLPSEGQEARYKTPERPTKSDSKQETPGESPIKPPLVIDAAVSAESQQRISRAEQGMLGASFEEADHLQSPARANHFDDTWEKKKEIERLLAQLPQPDNGSVDQLLKNCEGKEELLLKQLRDKVESQPFDEPYLDEAPSPSASPPRMSARTTTYMSKASATTKSSTITDKTQRIKNTLKGKNLIETISENQSTATSISSHHDSEDHLMPPSSHRTQYHNDYRIPSKVPVPRERSLNVEELTNSRVAAETFDSRGRVARSGRDNTENNVDGSYFGDNEEDDTYGTDSVSALSEIDVDFSHRKENFETARRRALDDAIEREDWELAAALSEGMRAAHSTGDFAKAHSSWNQSELDKFIANNDWDAVKSYIARMREDKKEALEGPLPPIDRTSADVTIPVVEAPSRAIPVVKAPSRGNPVAKAPSRPNPSLASSSQTPSSSRTPSLVINPGPELAQATSLKKRIGSRSQLQHKQLLSAESSWTSDSYDSEESYDSEYS